MAKKNGIAGDSVQFYPCFLLVSLARTFILKDLFVEKPYRRLGVGTKPLEAAIKRLNMRDRKRRFGRHCLHQAASAETQALYQAADWKRKGQFYVYHLAVI
jgi:GNAT superfamily N-acetyltransferase